MRNLRALFKKDAFIAPILFAIFIVPLVYIPGMFDGYEAHKSAVVILAALASGLWWLIRGLREKKYTLRWSWSMTALDGVIIAAVLAALYSFSPFTSWIGGSTGNDTSVLFLTACVFISVLLAQVHEKAALLRVVATVWGIEACIGVGVLALNTMLSTSLPQGLTVGTPYALVFFLGIAAFLVIHQEHRRISTCALGALLLLALFADASMVWIALIGVSIAVLLIRLAQASEGEQNFHRVGTPLIVIAVLGMLWMGPNIAPNILSHEVMPSWALSGKIMQGVWSEGVGRTLLGSGPGTFDIAYLAHAPQSINESPFWDVVFEKGSAQVVTLFTTQGLLGGCAFLILQIIVLWCGALLWMRNEEKRKEITGLLLALVFLAISAWVYSWGTVLTFAWFVLVGMLFAYVAERVTTWRQKEDAKHALVGAVICVMWAMIGVFVAGVGVTRYAAEYAYAQAHIAQVQGDETRALSLLEQAATLNKKSDVYARDFAGALLMRMANIGTSQESPEAIEQIIGGAINSAARATTLEPMRLVNWETRGNVYRELSQAVADAAPFAQSAFETAVTRAPSNPKIRVGLARAYIARADVAGRALQVDASEEARTAKESERAAFLAQAERALKDALALKPNYTPAQYFLGLVYEAQGNHDAAQVALKNVCIAEPENRIAATQLALIMLRQGDVAGAEQELVRILTVSPTYANARWYLSVIYEQQGKVEEAIQEMEEIMRIQGESPAVTQRLERLREGTVSEEIETPPSDMQGE